MPKYEPDDINRQTVIRKNGDLTFSLVCQTLQEAVIEVANRWSKDDQEKAQFKIVGKGYEYSWSDIKAILA